MLTILGWVVDPKNKSNNITKKHIESFRNVLFCTQFCQDILGLYDIY